jgi:hypothetical protein
MFNDKPTCVQCGSDVLTVVSCVVVNARIPLYQDGFYLGDGHADTEDEVIECGNGHRMNLLDLFLKDGQ